MSTENNGKKTFVAGEALEQFRRVKLSTSSGTQVEYADAGADFIGITLNKVASGEPVAVQLRDSGKTQLVQAADSFAVGAALYGANDGKVSDSASGSVIGVALQAASGDGSVIEAILNNGVGATSIDGASTPIVADGGNGVLPIVFSKQGITDANAADVTIVTAPYKFRIIDWWLISRDTTAANIKLKNVSTDASAVKAKGATDDAIVRGGDIIEAQRDVAAGAALKVNASAVAAFDIFVMAIKVA